MSGLKIISADQRMAEQGGIKGVIFGPAKIGKTSLLWTLDPATTLFVDLEAGGLSVQGWSGDSLEVRDWDAARDIACYLGGPNPAMRADQAYSNEHYSYVCDQYGDPAALQKYQTIFVDSITVASRLAFQWASGQPQAFSEKTGKPDTRGAYGLLGKEMIGWVTQLQHVGSRNVWFVGLLDTKRDDFNREYFEPQIEGSKTGLELPGIVDEVVTMTELRPEQGEPYRAFVCRRPNQWEFPAGDRSGKLDLVEPPHLGKLMQKIRDSRRPEAASYNYDIATD
ncbi:MAG: ATP-binding protein [Desulfovibrio sp.]|uniref:ATP-binding protein n=1 Tax=Desulfovibrio sp. TaxID=885 RepID=UPI002A36913F|nr:ATP-binding protein [Desulfovibrio sp.]MDY0258669.1 ATP-binding protein [Desulfovibrio sp.]